MEGYWKFIRKSAAVVIAAGAILLAIYIILDPMKVIRGYDDYYPASDRPSVWVGQSTVTVRNWDRRPDKRAYNAFLIGGSLSGHIPADTWRRYLPDDARVYHFYSSWEGPLSIAESVELFERDSVDLKYALLVISQPMFHKNYTYLPAEISHPRIQSDLSPLRYHWVFLKSFYHRDFWRSFLASSILGSEVEIEGVKALSNEPILWDSANNEMRYPHIEANMATHFTEHRWSQKPKPNQQRTHTPGLRGERLRAMERIREVFDRNNTDYQVLIPPSALADVANEQDLAELKRIFGDDRVHYLGQTMRWTAQVDSLWEDEVHYGTRLAAMMLDSVYSRR